ncbi:hypothetical protein CRYUN_Cryun09bG0172100 [Craigia yunnanensis]
MYKLQSFSLRIIGSFSVFDKQVGGLLLALEKHIEAGKSKSLFQGTDFKLASSHHPLNDKVALECGFTSLSIRVVNELVTFSSHPLLKAPEVSNAGRHLSAAEFHSVLQSGGIALVLSLFMAWQLMKNGSPTDDKQLVLLDARNLYETRIDKFHAPSVETLDPGIRQYSDLSSWIDDNSEQLTGKHVLMYCTGGISCEMASAYIRSKGVGFENVFQLFGGMQRYLEQFPDGGFFREKNFVFDHRTHDFMIIALNYQAIRRHTYSAKKISDFGQPTPASHPQLMMEGEITPGITTEEYISRRKRLLELLPEKSLAIISAAPVKMMTDVVPYTFRQDADYLYLTGCQQPGGVAALSHECGLCMFMPEAKAHDVVWQGKIAGVDAALEMFKAEIAYPMSKLDEPHRPTQIWRPAHVGKVSDLSIFTHELRWVKSPAELKLMKESASIACQALLQTMLHSKTYPHEGMLSAKVEYECRMRGAQRMAFNPVVGGGPNGSVIHYSRNDQKIKDGNLVLMDVGCELHGYCSDLTRTWPPCGSFSSVQEEVYDLILQTNKECMRLCKPGASICQIHNHSVELLCRGLKEIGILKRDEFRSYNQLNPTSIGHYLGMDVHDSSMISYDRPLKSGVVPRHRNKD